VTGSESPEIIIIGSSNTTTTQYYFVVFKNMIVFEKESECSYEVQLL
jgi:hypothetical protein